MGLCVAESSYEKQHEEWEDICIYLLLLTVWDMYNEYIWVYGIIAHLTS
jgi:hypothetical protein